jgi:RimJ/RimL family protein N-acetyltransferase
MEGLSLEELKAEDCELIAAWNASHNEDYRKQWAGVGSYQYPLTAEQIRSRMPEEGTLFYKILLGGEMVGSVELCQVNPAEGLAKVCRFILRDDVKGKGVGQAALKLLSDNANAEQGITRLKLRVYAYNIGALRCYQKAGYLVEEYKEVPENPKWNSYLMGFQRI